MSGLSPGSVRARARMRARPPLFLASVRKLTHWSASCVPPPIPPPTHSHIAAAALPEGCPALAALPFVEYLTPEGALQDVSPPAGSATGASLYAIFDASEALHFVGLSRDIMASLRAHLARTPEETHLLKVTHFGRGVRRDELEAASAAWVHEAGGAVGMDGGAVQRAWEGAIDVGPLMDAEDRAAVAATAEGSKERRLALKVACRKVEAQLKAVLKARHVTEPIRYDPKVRYARSRARRRRAAAACPMTCCHRVHAHSSCTHITAAPRPRCWLLACWCLTAQPNDRFARARTA